MTMMTLEQQERAVRLLEDSELQLGIVYNQAEDARALNTRREHCLDRRIWAFLQELRSGGRQQAA